MRSVNASAGTIPQATTNEISAQPSRSDRNSNAATNVSTLDTTRYVPGDTRTLARYVRPDVFLRFGNFCQRLQCFDLSRFIH